MKKDNFVVVVVAYAVVKKLGVGAGVGKSGEVGAGPGVVVGRRVEKLVVLLLLLLLVLLCGGVVLVGNPVIVVVVVGGVGDAVIGFVGNICE